MWPRGLVPPVQRNPLLRGVVIIPRSSPRQQTLEASKVINRKVEERKWVMEASSSQWYVLFKNAAFEMMLFLDFKIFEMKIIEFW
jgi:hypothetical protein